MWESSHSLVSRTDIRTINVLLTVGLCAVLVDFPDTAKFLTPEEKSYIIWKKSAGTHSSAYDKL